MSSLAFSGQVLVTLSLLGAEVREVDPLAADPLRRTAVIAIGGETPAPSIGGDPYVFPLRGPAVKLPNCPGFYRMLQIPSLNIVMNVEVAKATPEQQRALLLAAPAGSSHGGLQLVDEGFFNSRVFVSVRGENTP